MALFDLPDKCPNPKCGAGHVAPCCRPLQRRIGSGKMKSEQERWDIADAAAAHLPEIPPGNCIYWSEADVAAMRAAFAKRFNENQPRTETLFAVAVIGYRAALRDMMAGSDKPKS
jgi:hypothetical protein